MIFTLLLECLEPLRHLLAATPAIVASPSRCVPKAASAVYHEGTFVGVPFLLKSSTNEDFCPHIISWLLEAIGVVRK